MRRTVLVFIMSMLWISTIVANNDKQTILLLGDSLSAAYGIDPAKSWIILLQNRLNENSSGFYIVNASTSGNTTLEGLSKLPLLLKKHHPEIAIVALGGNDGLRGLKIQTIKQNLSKIITILQSKKIKILLVGVRIPPNYGVKYTNDFQEMYSELAEKYHVALVPKLLDKVAENPTLMQQDGLHPTEKAQPLIMETVYSRLKALIINFKKDLPAKIGGGLKECPSMECHSAR